LLGVGLFAAGVSAAAGTEEEDGRGLQRLSLPRFLAMRAWPALWRAWMLLERSRERALTWEPPKEQTKRARADSPRMFQDLTAIVPIVAVNDKGVKIYKRAQNGREKAVGRGRKVDPFSAI